MNSKWSKINWYKNSAWTISTPTLTVDWDLSNSSTINTTTITTVWDLSNSSTINSTTLTVTWDLSTSWTINNHWVITVPWNMTIENGWLLTHWAVSASSFNLLVDWILEINSWWKIDMTWKWISSIWNWSTRMWWSYWWQWRNNWDALYWDVYNPIEVWSYWRSTSYRWWWLVRMTVWNLINNGEILSNGTDWSRWRWSWWSINILVNSNLSWSWIYEANWWECTNSSAYDWWWWRIAIKYWSVDNLEELKSNSLATWPATAWEGTIYFINNTTWDEYLLIKWHWLLWNKTWVWNSYTDYYFSTIEVTDGAKLYQMWTEDIFADMCIIGWDVVWEIDSNINCDWSVSFRYYDLRASLTNFSLFDRKYEYSIEWPEWWFTVMWTSNWVVNWNWTISNRIKFTRLWTYTITFDLYDWNEEDSEILETVIKNVTIRTE